ncbi:hypothetical protein [Nostoc piscinale]|nr:hypothetical protein [Nostoc piscinale]
MSAHINNVSLYINDVSPYTNIASLHINNVSPHINIALTRDRNSPTCIL